MNNKIEKIKEKANYKMDLLKIKNDVDIEKMNLDNKLLKAENDTINIKRDNMLLKNKNGLFDRLKRSGRVLSWLGVLSFLVSTALSLISGYSVIKKEIFFAGFVLIMAVCQTIIFISAKYNSTTKENFAHRYANLKALQISMLLVSLTLNVMFIHECFNSYLLDIIMFPLAFVLDYSTIFFSGMGYDFKTLCFNVSSEKVTLFEKFIDNLLHGLRTKIEGTYNKNHNVKSSDVKTLDQDVKTNVKSLKHVKRFKCKKPNVKSQVLKDLNVKSSMLKEDVKSQDVKTNIESIENVKTSDQDIRNLNTRPIDLSKDNVKSSNVKTSNVIMLKDSVKSSNVKRNVKTNVKRDNVKRFEDVKSYIVKTYQNNDLIDVKTLKEMFKLSAREWQNVKREIPELVTKGTNTYFINNKGMVKQG